MRKLIIVLLFIFLIPPIAYAETEKNSALRVTIRHTTADDPEAVVHDGIGLQVSWHRKITHDISIYPYVSVDQFELRFGGQRGVPEANLCSLGFGFEYIIKKYLTFFLEFGWYELVFDEEGKKQIFRLPDGTHAPQSHLAEGLFLHCNNRWSMPDRAWDYYTLDYLGGAGGEFGLAFNYPVYDWLEFSMAICYRHLNLPERIRGKDYGNDVAFWALKENRTFGGFQIGGAITIRF